MKLGQFQALGMSKQCVAFALLSSGELRDQSLIFFISTSTGDGADPDSSAKQADSLQNGNHRQLKLTVL